MRWRAAYFRLLGYKTIKEMMAEMKAGRRKEINHKEIMHGQALEKALLPRGLYFPKKGETWEALVDFKIHYMTAYSAPNTGGGEAILPRGECVICASDREPPFVGVYFDPVRYEYLHEQMVSEEERMSPHYNGYYFFIDTVDLNRYFRRVGSL